MRFPRSTRWLSAAAFTAAVALAAGSAAATTVPDDATDATDTAAPTDACADGAATQATEATQATNAADAASTPTTEEASGWRRPATANPDASLVVGAVLEPTSLDIVTQAGAAIDQVLLDNVYETLLLTNDEGTTEAGLVELPEISEDGCTYTITVPDGITFHNGDPLTASDIVWSLDAFRAETGVGAENLATIAAVEAPDDHTVVITLSQRDNDLLFRLSRREGAVLQADATDLGNTAVGTGPFTLSQWNQGSSITLTRYDGYHGDPAGVAEVTFQYFTDPNAAVNALTSGDADLLTGVNTDLVGQFEGDDDYVVTQGTTNGEFTLGMNNTREPFDDPDVRRAIRQAIDKEGYLALLNGFGTIIGSPVPPTDPWYEDLTGVAPYDPEAAAQALRDAGVAEGTQFTLKWPNFYATTGAEYVASQLAEVGLQIEIVPVEFAVWLDEVYTAGDYDLTAVLHVEPRDIANYANPDYYWHYDNPEVQQLINDAKVAPTEDEANDMIRQAAQIIAEDSPVDWLILQADIVVATPNITGYPTNDTASRFDASGIEISS
ncbi:MAG: ABC transporter substrate-binding protein [Desertimonas sp.]